MAAPDKPTDKPSDNTNLPIPGLVAEGQVKPGENNISRVTPEQSKNLEQQGVLPKIDENITKIESVAASTSFQQVVNQLEIADTN